MGRRGDPRQEFGDEQGGSRWRIRGGDLDSGPGRGGEEGVRDEDPGRKKGNNEGSDAGVETLGEEEGCDRGTVLVMRGGGHVSGRGPGRGLGNREW